MADGLTLNDLPTDSGDLFIWSEQGADAGVGTADEFRQLVSDGIIADADAVRFRVAR
jgi:hypothetical protein